MFDPVSGYPVRMMPNQIPYTFKELKLLYKMVSDAADEDPSEDMEDFINIKGCNYGKG